MTSFQVRSITCPIFEKVTVIPDNVAIVSNEKYVSYKELDTLISSIAYQLDRMGVERGDRVAIFLDSNVEYIVLLFALFRLGGIGVALNTRLPDESIPDLLQHISCNCIISDGRFDAFDSDNELSHMRLQDFVWSEKATSEVSFSPISINQQATIIFSSGSTGTPKAILHSFGNHYYSALGSNQNIAINQKDRWLLSLPLYHVAGIAILFRSFIAGATVVISTKRLPISECLNLFEISHASFVATQFQEVLKAAAVYPKLKAILVGGSAVSAIIRSDAHKKGLPVFFSYGLSEMSSQVTTTPPNMSQKEIQTSGYLLPYRDLKIDRSSEIQVKGDTLFLGYLERNKTILPVDEQGWFSTGDLGELDDQGLLTVWGRKDNMFISGGENIYPEQIEKAIQSHSGVRNVLVVPVQDEKFGMRPVAFIDAEQFDRLIDEIEAFLGGKLARYMHPIAYFDWKYAPEKIGIKDNRKLFSLKAEYLMNLNT